MIDYILFGALWVFFAYILIDLRIQIKKQTKERNEKNAQRIKDGKEPIDYDKISIGGGGSSESEANEQRSRIFRNMGGTAGI